MFTDTTPVKLNAFSNELSKLAGGGALSEFWHGAKHEIGPALGAVTGAGVAKMTGMDPLAGAAAGYGLGAAPDIVRAVKEKRLAKQVAALHNAGGAGI